VIIVGERWVRRGETKGSTGGGGEKRNREGPLPKSKTGATVQMAKAHGKKTTKGRKKVKEVTERGRGEKIRERSCGKCPGKAECFVRKKGPRV